MNFNFHFCCCCCCCNLVLSKIFNQLEPKKKIEEKWQLNFIVEIYIINCIYVFSMNIFKYKMLHFMIIYCDRSKYIKNDDEDDDDSKFSHLK